MNSFVLQRDIDESGISGTALVAEGIQFSDGRCAMRWVASDVRSTVTYDSIQDVESIHGHNGNTRIVWQ